MKVKIEPKTGGVSRQLRQKTDLITSAAVCAHFRVEHQDEANESLLTVTRHVNLEALSSSINSFASN